jgi:hypothetical protein
MKTTKELSERKKKKLEELRSTQDVLAEKAEYAIDCTLSENDIDRNIHHGKCLISPHIQMLLYANAVKGMDTNLLCSLCANNFKESWC